MQGFTKRQNLGDGRRSYRRYPIDLEIRCSAPRSGSIVVGRICDISSGGVRFSSSESMAPGTVVTCAIDWPVLRNGVCRLQLNFQGRVLRIDERGTAVEFGRTDFCTQSTATAALGGAAAIGT